MRWRLVLAGVVASTLASVTWLLTSLSDEPLVFGFPVSGERADAQVAPASRKAAVRLSKQVLPKTPPAEGPMRNVQQPASDVGREMRDPVTLARSVLLDDLRSAGPRPPSRAQHVEELRRELTALRRDLETAAVAPSGESLSQVRSRLDQTRAAAGRVFPKESPSTSPANGAASFPAGEVLAARGLEVRTPRPAPPGVLDRIRGGKPVAIPPAPQTQLARLLDGVDDALSAAQPDPVALQRAARGIDMAMAQTDAGQGPALRYSTVRLEGSR